MIRIECQGTTEISTGKSIKSNFVFLVDDNAVELLLANECKVRTRASHRKHIATTRDGDTVIVNFVMNGDKVSSTITDEKAARRNELMAIGMDETKSPEERIAALDAIRSL